MLSKRIRKCSRCHTNRIFRAAGGYCSACQSARYRERKARNAAAVERLKSFRPFPRSGVDNNPG